MNLDRYIIDLLRISADASIENALLRGAPIMINSPRTEVGLVAAIVLGGVRDIGHVWRPLLANAGYELQLTGIFCHAAPQVQYYHHTRVQCELADLLLVVDVIESGAATRVAALVQAKMANRASHVSLKGSSSIRQLMLFSSWPSFSFVDQSYGNEQYNLATDPRDDAGTIGVIDRHFRKTSVMCPRWTQHSAVPVPTHVRSSDLTLGAYLAAMATLRSGVGRVCSKPSDWAYVIEKLMSITYSKLFKHTGTLGRTLARRGVTVCAFLSPSAIAQASASAQLTRSGQVMAGEHPPPTDRIPVFPDPEGPNGINLLHAVLKQTDVEALDE